MVNGVPIKEPMISIDGIISQWSYKAQRVARKIADKYGNPIEATPSMLIWYHNGPWKRTVVNSRGPLHNFPLPHTDLLEQVVDYWVPLDKVDDIVSFDGSIKIDRTSGELGVCCDREETNFLALNLAHEIVVGKKTAEEARQKYADAVLALRRNWPEPYAEDIQFGVESDESVTADPDEAVTGQSMMQKLFK